MKTIVFNEEKFREFLQENVKGQSYLGMFRNHHAINFNLETGNFWEEWSASDNQIFPDADPFVRVFCNGNEGTYTKETYVASEIEELGDEIKEIYEISDGDWKKYKELDYTHEKVDFLINYEDYDDKNQFDVCWDVDEDTLVSYAKEKLAENIEGFDYNIIIE
jgi:hypothetical protein